VDVIHNWDIPEFSIAPLGVKIGFETSQRVTGRSGRKMEKRQQRFVIKFFWLREYHSRQTHQELFATLGSDAYSEDSVQYWVVHFESGDISCEDISRAGRPLTDLAELFCLFLQDYPFASARMLSRHFGVCATTVKDILARDLGLKKFTRRLRLRHCPAHKK
jgi:hypothetical protein